MEFRYNLQNGSAKQVCPSCGKKCFVPYIDDFTGKPLPERYGRCDREINCSYHLNPYSDGYAKPIKAALKGRFTGNQIAGGRMPLQPSPSRETSFMEFDVFNKSRSHYGQNNFVQWLVSLFDAEKVNELISKYHIGTSKHWPGATVFWQIDNEGKIRAGKIMLYHPKTGKRVKEPYTHITWAHKSLGLAKYYLRQCYFGTHLLNSSNKPVALVESEKTAIIASAYLPEFSWLAVGSLSNLSVEQCKVLAGRKVILFPDLNGFEKWRAKAKEIEKQVANASFYVSDCLEKIATDAEKELGLDLADFLLRWEYHAFVNGSNRPINIKLTGI